MTTQNALDTATGRDTQITHAIIGRSPGDVRARLGTAALRALRTLLQGMAAAFPAAGAGMVVLQATYWQTFAYSCLAALIAAIAAFLQNVAGILPEDPTQQSTNS
jgi:hypothetical protein